MLKELKELTFHQSMMAVLLFTGAVSPGLLVMCLYRPDVILDLDVLKLLMLSLSITLPFVIWNYLIFLYLVDYDLGVRTKTEFALMVLAINFMIFYQLLAFAFWFSWTFKFFSGMLIAMQTLLSLMIYLRRKWERVKEKLDEAKS